MSKADEPDDRAVPFNPFAPLGTQALMTYNGPGGEMKDQRQNQQKQRAWSDCKRNWDKVHQFKREKRARTLEAMTVERACQDFFYLYQLAQEFQSPELAKLEAKEFQAKLERIKRLLAAFTLLKQR